MLVRGPSVPVRAQDNPNIVRVKIAVPKLLHPGPKVLVQKSVIKPKPIPPGRAADIDRDKALAAKIASRERYRAKHNVTFDTCLHNLDQLDEFATVRAVTLPDGKTREWPVVSVTALGDPLNTTGVTTTRWLKRGMIPEPILRTARGQCYHVEEVRVMIQVIGDHQAEMKQYREAHTETKARLFERIARTRKALLHTS